MISSRSFTRSILTLAFLFVFSFAFQSLAKAEETCLSCHGNKSSRAPFVYTEEFNQSIHGANGCQSCHMDVDKYPHPTKVASVACDTCHSDVEKKFQKSLHGSIFEGKNICIQCHGKHAIVKPKEKGNSICVGCHEDVAREYNESVHGQAATKHDTDAAACFSCHTGHEVYKSDDPRSSVYPLNLPKTCGKCHGDSELAKKHNIPIENAYVLYLDSSHGRGVTESGLLVSANCSNCHGDHNIRAQKDPKSLVNRENIPKTCGKCHAGVEEKFQKSVHGKSFLKGNTAPPVCTDCHQGHEIQRVDEESWKLLIIRECGGCHLDSLTSYRHTYHGKVSSLGNTVAARCSDCHGSHSILPHTHPDSTLSSKNKTGTCAQCHPGATESFAKYIPHADYHDKERFPLLHIVYTSFNGLLFGTFAFWWLHTILWGFRSFREHQKKKENFNSPIKKKEEKGAQKYFWRFRLYHRITHGLIIVSFLGLAATGLPLRFADKPWASWLSHLFGGVQAAGIVHRVCACITFGYCFLHLGFILWKTFKKKEYGILWGPNSLVPQPRDLDEFIGHIKYFFGMGERPKFGRWTYWEKFDYWAVFWGVAIIGTSGLMLWFPTFFAGFLPGWIVNVATIVHSDEALLATGFIFTVHFFNSHLRPEEFPMDDVMFTGRVPEDELKEDKPGQYEALKTLGELKNLEAPPPEYSLKVFGWIFGFTAVAIGVGLAVLIFLI